MTDQLYRSRAVGHLTSPDQLDTEVRMVRPSGWIALSAVALVLIAFVVWCIFGTVQSTYPAAGVLLTQYGTASAFTPEAGEVTDLLVAQGDDVGEGDALAIVRTVDGEVTVTSPADGQIVEVLAYPGHRVDQDATVATIQPSDDDLRAFVFVPVSSSQPIRPGMPVQISVTTVPSEEYGLLLGTVASVGTHPASRAGVDALINNDDITAIIIGGAPVIQIEVALTSSSDTATGFAWTTPNGPPDPLAAGTLVNTQVVLSEQAPISVLFPTDRVGE